MAEFHGLRRRNAVNNVFERVVRIMFDLLCAVWGAIVEGLRSAVRFDQVEIGGGASGDWRQTRSIQSLISLKVRIPR